MAAGSTAVLCAAAVAAGLYLTGHIPAGPAGTWAATRRST